MKEIDHDARDRADYEEMRLDSLRWKLQLAQERLYRLVAVSDEAIACWNADKKKLAATEAALERETALLTEAKRQNADLMAIIDKRDEALGFVPLDKGMDMQDELRETKARLEKYGTHLDGCVSWRRPLPDGTPDPTQCTCGWTTTDPTTGSVNADPA